MRHDRREADVSSRRTDDPSEERALLIEAWLLGGTLTIAFAVWVYHALLG